MLQIVSHHKRNYKREGSDFKYLSEFPPLTIYYHHSHRKRSANCEHSPHLLACEEIRSAETPKDAEELSTYHGINFESPLNAIDHFDLTKCLPHDIMHILFEGIIPREMKLLLKWCIREKNFSL